MKVVISGGFICAFRLPYRRWKGLREEGLDRWRRGGERARILLAYREDPSFFAVGQALGLHHQTVQRCVERAVAEGPMAALDDRPRPGREPTLTVEGKAWLLD